MSMHHSLTPYQQVVLEHLRVLRRDGKVTIVSEMTGVQGEVLERLCEKESAQQYFPREDWNRLGKAVLFMPDYERIYRARATGRFWGQYLAIFLVLMIIACVKACTGE